MKHLEQEFKTKAELREDQQHVKKMKCKNRETEEELRRLEHKKNEDIVSVMYSLLLTFINSFNAN